METITDVEKLENIAKCALDKAGDCEDPDLVYEWLNSYVYVRELLRELDGE